MLHAACQQFLGKSTEQMRHIALETLEGHQRAIMGTMTVEVLIFSHNFWTICTFPAIDTGLNDSTEIGTRRKDVSGLMFAYYGNAASIYPYLPVKLTEWEKKYFSLLYFSTEEKELMVDKQQSSNIQTCNCIPVQQ